MSVDLWLRVDDPLQGPQVVCVVDEAVLGRDLRCDVVLFDEEASRRHARITPVTDRRWQVADLGTTNGTFVNAQRIVGPADVFVGDVIRCGRVSCAILDPHHH